MCGGFSPFTRDHILPKADYQTWSIFSKNLVPACQCNSKRGSAIKGNQQKAERILHPYYDDILQERLLSCNITRDNNNIDLEISFVDPNHPDIDAIKYHTKHVVLKSGAQDWMKGQLSKLYERPSNVIQTLPRKNSLLEPQIIDCIRDCLARTDELTGTPNNWLSILCHGLLNSAGISSWVTDRHCQTLVS
jgi:hypothetical protein